MNDFTPTDEQVRQGYAVDPEADYRDPLTNHTRLGEAAFDRWLAKHDAEVRVEAVADALEGAAEALEQRWVEQVPMSPLDTFAFLRERATEMRAAR